MIITNKILKNIDYDKIDEFNQNFVFASPHQSLLDFKLHMIGIINSKLKRKNHYFYEKDLTYPIINEENLRLWKLDSDITLNTFFNYVYNKCKRSASFAYRIIMQGDILNLTKNIEDLDLKENDLIIVEIKEKDYKWNFYREVLLFLLNFFYFFE